MLNEEQIKAMIEVERKEAERCKALIASYHEQNVAIAEDYNARGKGLDQAMWCDEAGKERELAHIYNIQGILRFILNPDDMFAACANRDDYVKAIQEDPGKPQ